MTPADLAQSTDSNQEPTVFDLSAADVPAAEEAQQEAHAADRHTVLAVPEHSHPGESASNGYAEAAVKLLVSQARTLKVALESRLRREKPIPCSHPVVAWLFEHAAWILSKIVVNHEGRTPWGLLHGREARERIAELGEKSFILPPKAHTCENGCEVEIWCVLGPIYGIRSKYHWAIGRIDYTCSGHGPCGT